MSIPRFPALALLLVVVGAPGLHGQTTPGDYAPVSINLEDVPYPHPVSYLELRLFGEDVRMAYMDVAPDAGANGRSVVLLHGMNFFGEYWAGTIEALVEAGYRVIVPDQIGYGRSSKPIIPYNLHKKAANTRKLLEELGIEEAAIVGHSMGGMVATRFAFSYPEATSHLALVNMIGMRDARLQRPWRDTDAVYRSNLDRSYAAIRQGQERYYVEWKPEYEKYVAIHYGWTLSSEWPRLAMVRALNQQMIYHDTVVYDFPHVQAPTLVIGGEEDGPSFSDMAREVAGSVPGAELVLFENVGHNPHLEAPERLHPELLRFLGTSR